MHASHLVGVLAAAASTAAGSLAAAVRLSAQLACCLMAVVVCFAWAKLAATSACGCIARHGDGLWWCS